MKRSNPIGLKVCGMRDTKNVLDVAALQPDYMGFIFYPQSKRAVGPGFIIPADLPVSIRRVGVFVNETESGILQHVRQHSLDYAQLHGDESPTLCEALRSAGVGVIKAFSISPETDFLSLKRYKNVVDYFLFDTKGAQYGGTGIVFDWSILKQYDQEIPFFLSGGLSPENVNKVTALRDMNIHALDVNSGVEITPGLKDIEKVRKVKASIRDLK